MTEDPNIRIHKFENGNISLQLLNATEIKSLDKILNSDDLLNEDLYIFQAGDGWKHLIDNNTEKVYPLTDYGYDYIDELQNGKVVRLYPMDFEDSIEILNEWRK